MLNFVKDTANFLTCKRKALKSRHGVIGKTVIPVIRHYDVVHKGNVEQCGCTLQGFGLLHVARTWMRISRRMIVHEYQSVGTFFQGLSLNFYKILSPS